MGLTRHFDRDFKYVPAKRTKKKLIRHRKTKYGQTCKFPRYVKNVLAQCAPKDQIHS